MYFLLGVVLRNLSNGALSPAHPLTQRQRDPFTLLSHSQTEKIARKQSPPPRKEEKKLLKPRARIRFLKSLPVPLGGGDGGKG